MYPPPPQEPVLQAAARSSSIRRIQSDTVIMVNYVGTGTLEACRHVKYTQSYQSFDISGIKSIVQGCFGSFVRIPSLN